MTMATDDLKALTVSKMVDARGTSCPGPILAAKKGIVGVPAGEVLEIQATDTATQRDLPAWARKMGHEFLGVVEEPGYWRLFVRRSR